MPENIQSCLTNLCHKFNLLIMDATHEHTRMQQIAQCSVGAKTLIYVIVERSETFTLEYRCITHVFTESINRSADISASDGGLDDHLEVQLDPILAYRVHNAWLRSSHSTNRFFSPCGHVRLLCTVLGIGFIPTRRNAGCVYSWWYCVTYGTIPLYHYKSCFYTFSFLFF